MLSYRHAFHAGNHADVLKHFVLTQILRHMTSKDKPFWYVDTHAGAGLYALDSSQAQKTAEFHSGIAKLFGRTDLPEALADYVDLVRSCNPEKNLRIYPGSPEIALKLLRREDKLKLFELHPSESKILAQNMHPAGRRASLVAGDGFAGLKAVLPPPPRRAMVLIDPPYEVKEDYRHVIASLKDSLVRFATGTYAVWYPQVQRPESRRFADQLRRVVPTNWLHVSLTVCEAIPGAVGLQGSGMYIINPPWNLPKTLEAVMPLLTKALGQDTAASFELDYHIS